MKKLIASVSGKICIALLALVLVAGASGIWLLCRPKFQNVTIDLGSDLPSVEAFLTKSADPAKAKLVTPAEEVDLTAVGQQTLIFSYGKKEYTVFLTIRDDMDITKKFRDVTIELGSELPPLESFLTKAADPSQAAMVTPGENIDLTKVGQQALTFRYGDETRDVTLTIQDTVAPQVTFRDVITAIDRQPEADEFVAEISDLSPTTVSYVQTPQLPETYGNAQVEIRVTDAAGNSVVGQCNLQYTWMYEHLTLELGQPLEKSHLLLNPEKDSDLIDQALLDVINAAPVGIYTISSTSMDQTCTCTITVQDTTAPTLELRAVQIDIGDRVSVNSFIKTAEDASGPVETKLLTTLELQKECTQTVRVEARDINGNVTTAETTLTVYLDSRAPVFSGVKEVTLQKNAAFDYSEGVSAVDARDGQVPFTVNSDNVDLTKAGTYYATYSARDSMGNVATVRRKITVEHDAADTQALVNSIAATLPNDPEKIRDYVRNEIGYSSSWGDKDAVWYGFTKKTGNCYVHALCLQQLLTAKGYETQLIWVTDKSHYWLIIKLNGVWRHIDATPGSVHRKYSLMTDEQRLSTLSGRDWDHSIWPACE